MKKSRCLVALALVMCLSVSPVAALATIQAEDTVQEISSITTEMRITSVDAPSQWAEQLVSAAIANNLVPQQLQSNYTQQATRAEFAALAVTVYETATGSEIAQRKTFDDTTDINVEKAAAIGVVSGVGNNLFSPNAELTSEQAAVMLAQLAQALDNPLPVQAPTFSDAAHISPWAAGPVGQVQAAGIIGGVGNNIFAPQSAFTREQSIVTMFRLYDVVQGYSYDEQDISATTVALEGSYRWQADSDSGMITCTYTFDSDGTVLFSQEHSQAEAATQTASGTYVFQGDALVTTTGHDYDGITYDAATGTIIVRGSFGTRVFEYIG